MIFFFFFFDRAIQAEACITHHGHPIQLEYLKIPPKDKREIASKIVKGKKWDHILAEYHESGLKQGKQAIDIIFHVWEHAQKSKIFLPNKACFLILLTLTL